MRDRRSPDRASFRHRESGSHHVPRIQPGFNFGVDRILFSVDYPFASNARARAFLDALPVSPADRIKIAHGNADRLLRLPPGGL